MALFKKRKRLNYYVFVLSLVVTLLKVTRKFIRSDWKSSTISLVIFKDVTEQLQKKAPLPPFLNLAPVILAWFRDGRVLDLQLKSSGLFPLHGSKPQTSHIS